jgi:transposase-like protein
MIKHMLENEGIPCFLHNEQTANLVPGSVYQVGIQVMVHEQNAEKALRLLNQQEDRKAIACPVCRSENIQIVKVIGGMKKILLFLTAILYAIPSGSMKQKFTCNNCRNHFWA